VNLETT